LSAWLEQAKYIIEAIARCVEFAAAMIIAVAAVEAVMKAALIFVQRNRPASAKNEVRLTLGRWLAVALEFELAADILNTAVTPTWSDIEKLAAIAALRTALNYFLEREIRQEAAPEQRVAEDVLQRSDRPS
jgi:uncharacterized membrane protein